MVINIESKSFLEDLSLRKSLLTSIQYFLIGFLMADIYLTDWKHKKYRKVFAWDLIGFIAITGLFYTANDYDYFGYIIFLGSTLLLFVAAFRGRYMNQFFTNTYITIIGGMCYTIYLIHYAFMSVLMDFSVVLFATNDYLLSFLIQLVVVIPILLFVSALTFYCIERPFMFKNWPQQFYYKLKVILFTQAN